MKKLGAILVVLVLIQSCTLFSSKKEENLISQINKEMTTAPTAFGDIGDEKLEVLPVNELSSIQLKYPPRDQNGWTILTPSEDSRIMYVSSSEGDDATAQAYNMSEVSDVFDPSYVSAFKTFAAAQKLTRDGFPDWILLKKGDEWIIDKRLKSYSGRSASEPMVISSYSSDSSKRPLIKSKGVDGFGVGRNNRFYSIIGLEFYAYQRDPNSVDFVGWDKVQKISGFTSYSSLKRSQITEAIVLEDNVFNYYAINIALTGKGGHKDIVVRRNKMLNAYTTSGHAQGMFATQTNMLFEENLMDHNGWFQKSFIKLNSPLEGQATFFNHNAYFENIFNSIIRNNILSRASSIGMKFTSNSSREDGINLIKAQNLIIDNNLVIEGEIGFSLGGNTDFNNGYRWKNINVLNNVFLNIGHSQPTNRALAWSIDANDWASGTILGNYMLFNDNLNVDNVIGIRIKGLSKDINVGSNVIYKTNAKGGKHIVVLNNEGLTDVSILQNYIDYIYDNSYSRHDITTYMATQGEEESLVGFIAKARELSKDNWDIRYTAEIVNKYLKAQFD